MPFSASFAVGAAAIDCVVVGAGVVGLAIARRLATSGMAVLVLEAEAGIGTGISSRSSSVIHAGLYDHAASLRGRLCIAGRRALYAYCRQRGIEARACGKLVVAADDRECGVLEAIFERAQANGVEDCRLLSAAEALAMEPALACQGALLSPPTGIVDSHAYMLSLQGEAEAAGALFAFRTKLAAIRRETRGFTLQFGGSDPTSLFCRGLVNAAGLGAADIARRIDGLEAVHIPRTYLSKGSYFSIPGRAPFARLIYPVPIPGGAGIHLTFDLAGRARFGPDVEAVDEIDYRVDPARSAMFEAAIRRYWPALPAGVLTPDYAGIRPGIAPVGERGDFRIDTADRHGLPGLVNLFGIESPGLTASLAIADYVADALA